MTKPNLMSRLSIRLFRSPARIAILGVTALSVMDVGHELTRFVIMGSDVLALLGADKVLAGLKKRSG